MAWFRFHTHTVRNKKIQRLPAYQYRDWANLLCLARENNGVLPSIKDIAYEFRINEKQVKKRLQALIDANLFEETENGIVPHDWGYHQFKSDTSTSRVKEWRDKQRNKDETPEETEVERSSNNDETFPETSTEIQNTEIQSTEYREGEKKKKNRPDSVNDVIGYFNEIGCKEYDLEGEKFWDYFSSNGWKIGGRTAMNDWKAAVRNWHRRNKQGNGNGANTGKQKSSYEARLTFDPSSAEAERNRARLAAELTIAEREQRGSDQ